jgi:1-acyl-sn-glycerol-3-phosphate acyltransferase
MRSLGRALLPVLTRTTIRGQEHFPEGGPLLVVGNHVAAMEVVLMVVYAPWQIELLGPGDLPPPPWMHAVAGLYGYTPIRRGSADRDALRKALDVLEQGGVVGIFPGGGIRSSAFVVRQRPGHAGLGSWMPLKARTESRNRAP